MKPVRVTLVPLVVAIAAFFVILPRTGGDVTLRVVEAGGSFAYDPRDLETGEDARVRIVNDTETTHTFTAVAGAFDIELQPGESGFLDPVETGTLEYYCRYHGSSHDMTGSVTFGEATTPAEPAPSVSPTV